METKTADFNWLNLEIINLEYNYKKNLQLKYLD